MKAWADKLGMTEAASLLDETLQQEKATDKKLTSLADSEIKIDADHDKPAKKVAGRKR